MYDHSSSDIVSLSLLSFFSLFSVINPIKFVVVFLSMTYFLSKEKRNQVANKSMFVAFVILVISVLFGEYIFKFLNIDMYSFKIAGGILLTIGGINMLLGSDVELPSSEQIADANDDIAIFPLAIPIITGPGAISTGILLFSDANDFLGHFIVLLSIILNFILMFVVLHLSYTIANKLNKLVLNILYRSCGLLLSALAVNIFISGVKDSGLFG